MIEYLINDIRNYYEFIFKNIKIFKKIYFYLL